MAWDGIRQDRIEITKQITDSKGNIMTLILLVLLEIYLLRSMFYDKY